MVEKLKNKVFLKQKRIIRIVCNESFNAHTDNLFKRLEILKLQDLIDLEIQKLMYKHSKDMLPLPLMSLFPVSTTKYFTRQHWLPCIKKPNYEPLQKSFLTKGPKLWRSITNDTKESKHLKSFTICIKKSKLLNYWCTHTSYFFAKTSANAECTHWYRDSTNLKDVCLKTLTLLVFSFFFSNTIFPYLTRIFLTTS